MNKPIIWFSIVGLVGAVIAASIWVLPFKPSFDQVLFMAEVFMVPMIITLTLLIYVAIRHKPQGDRDQLGE